MQHASIWTEVTAAPCSDDKRIAAQRIAERQAKTALQRLGDDGRETLADRRRETSSLFGLISSCQFF